MKEAFHTDLPILKSKGVFWGFLVLLMAGVFSYYGIWDWWSMGPVSVHRWRQADSISQVLCYFENGLQFFRHQVHNLEGEGGAAVSEFPVLYFLTACFYHLVGEHPGILRIIHLMILVWGLSHYAVLVAGLSQHRLMGLLGVVLILGSPIIAFYGFNFLPNIPALGFMLAGFGFYYSFTQSRKNYHFWFFILLNTLAGLLKATMIVPFLAWLGTWILIRLLFKNPDVHLAPFYPQAKKVFQSAMWVLAINLIWLGWVRYYNAAHGSVNFLTTIYPVWELEGQEVSRIWNMILEKRFTRWFAPFTFLILLVWSGITFFRKNETPKPVWIFFMLLWAGAVSVFLLFYFQFQHHDYYLIDLMYLPMAGLTVLCYDLGRWIRAAQSPDSFWQSIPGSFIILWVVLLVPALWNVQYAKSHLEHVFSPGHSDMRGFPPGLYEDIPSLRAHVQNLGLDYKKDKVLTLPDPSFNVSLYYLNLRGFTHKNVALPKEKWEQLWKKGVRYVIVFNSELISHPDLKKITSSYLGSFKEEVFFYKMQSPFRKEE